MTKKKKKEALCAVHDGPIPSGGPALLLEVESPIRVAGVKPSPRKVALCVDCAGAVTRYVLQDAEHNAGLAKRVGIQFSPIQRPGGGPGRIVS